jgi:hypothetical protein
MRGWFAEIWNPISETWSTDADLAVPRTYHSVAVLMPDGRVFTGGGGLCGIGPACNGGETNHPDAQMYSPRYLFNPNGTPATRPTCNINAASIGMRPFPNSLHCRCLSSYLFEFSSVHWKVSLKVWAFGQVNVHHVGSVTSCKCHDFALCKDSRNCHCCGAKEQHAR